MATVTSPYRREPYAAIDPTAPANSQAGRSVLITGAGAGIGFAAARAFVRAHAAAVIIVGRRKEVIAAAVKELEAEAEAARAQGTTIRGLVCDIASGADQDRLWKALEADGVGVDVLILNAFLSSQAGVLLKGAEESWRSFETNVHANLLMTERFLAQGPNSGKVLLNVSTSAAHSNPAPHGGTYSASKVAMASLMQHLADERGLEEVRIVNINPGAVFTEGAEKAGYKREQLPWDSVDLPASFFVWAATSQADFLHGRFVWANWDVDGLRGMEEKIKNDAGFLRIGLQGIPSVDLQKTFAEIFEMEKKEDGRLP